MSTLKRCTCDRAEVEEDAELPGTLICKRCGGWFAVSIDSVEALERFRERFSNDDHSR